MATPARRKMLNTQSGLYGFLCVVAGCESHLGAIAGGSGHVVQASQGGYPGSSSETGEPKT